MFFNRAFIATGQNSCNFYVHEKATWGLSMGSAAGRFSAWAAYILPSAQNRHRIREPTPYPHQGAQWSYIQERKNARELKKERGGLAKTPLCFSEKNAHIASESYKCSYSQRNYLVFWKFVLTVDALITRFFIWCSYIQSSYSQSYITVLVECIMIIQNRVFAFQCAVTHVRLPWPAVGR